MNISGKTGNKSCSSKYICKNICTFSLYIYIYIYIYIYNEYIMNINNVYIYIMYIECIYAIDIY